MRTVFVWMHLQQMFTLRDFQRRFHRRLPTRRGAREVLRDFERAGFLGLVEGPGGRGVALDLKWRWLPTSLTEIIAALEKMELPAAFR